MDSVHPISARLKQAREYQNLSVTELSKLTNIRIHIIQALDEGRVDELPKVYMRSFIKRYALAVGISSDDIEELMDRHLAVPSGQPAPLASPLSMIGASATKVMKAPIHLGPSKSRRRILAILYSVLGLAGIAGLYYMYGPSRNPQVQKSPLAPSVIISDKDSGASQNTGGLASYFGVSSIDSVSLDAMTSDTVWLNITVDGRASEQLTLYPQQTKHWMAAEKFILSVGNAGGISLKRNGQDLPPLGKKGETVRSIRITRSEFVTSASPWKSQRDTIKKTSTAKAATSSANSVSSSAAAQAALMAKNAKEAAARKEAQRQALLAAQRAAAAKPTSPTTAKGKSTPSPTQMTQPKSPAVKSPAATQATPVLKPNTKPPLSSPQKMPSQSLKANAVSTNPAAKTTAGAQKSSTSASKTAVGGTKTTSPTSTTASGLRPTDKAVLTAKQRQEALDRKKRLERIRAAAAESGQIKTIPIK